MAAEREPPTLADYAVTAVSPVLIMLMVGSLVFFLVTVLPTGDYKERLLYTSFFFVIGAVLVARIAIQIDSGRAAMYGAGLALVTFLAMTRFVEYPSRSWLASFGWLVNLGLMGLIWWSAHKLTWDCTHIDEKKEASGRGVLAAAGLDADAGKSGSGSEGERKDKAEPVGRDAERGADEPRGRKRKKKRKKQASPLADWLERYRKYREERKNRPHTPGVWVIYFALAALPLFALGQSLIDPADDDRRRATFLQMAAYIASALGLLVTTALLGLRRYLRQRKARVPTAMTASWLGFGGVLIVVFLLVGAFLPRPHSEVPWFGIARPGKSDRQASRYAPMRDSAGKGEGAAGDVTEKGQGKASGKDGEKGGNDGQKGDGGGKGDGKGGKGKNGKQGGKSEAGQKSGEGKERDDKSSEDKSDDRSSGGPDDDRRSDAKGEGGSRDKSSGSSPKTGVAAAVEKVAGFLKWVVFAILAFLVIVGIALAILRYLAPFTEWARNLLDALRNWWASLFGGKKATRAREEEAVAAPPGPVRPPPFTTFSNPFEDGTADGREPAELVEYTFAAVDAWAWDRGHGRQPTETPLEFAARLGEEFPALAEALRRLANLYARVAYSTAALPADVPAQLEQFWDQLIHGAVEPAVVAEV
jgi:hypothetical protein